ncbi:uncharacterized protein LOC117779886 [Drosophila innubila]|uniref:uncharacterized protein LOC117779886 n=1 Tax=Drosophila innubila TaxID=198719 RepID=UPI00148BCEEB|nr:uncharacterized protein LOC117779886 [Drosophila innubila]
MHLQHKSNTSSCLKTGKMGFACLENYVQKCSCQVKGLRWERDQRCIQNISIKLRVMGFTHLEDLANEFKLDLRGLSWKKESKLIENLPLKIRILGLTYLEDFAKENSFKLKGSKWEKEHKFIRILPIKIQIMGFTYLEDFAKQYRYHLRGLSWSTGQKIIQNLPLKLKIMEFVYLEDYAKINSFELKGFKWEEGLQNSVNLPDRPEIEDESSIEEIDMLRDEERCKKIVYIVDWEMRQLILGAYARLMISDSEEFCRKQSIDSSSLSKASWETLTDYDRQSEDSDETLTSVVEDEKIDVDNKQLVTPQEQIVVFKPSVERFSTIRTKFQHQRHIIAAPRVIIQLFRCNPSYRCCPCNPNAPNFFEQLAQFSEIMGVSGKDCPLDAVGIRARIELTMRQIMYEPLWSPELCIREIAKIQLLQLLTLEEQREYEMLRWHYRDRGVCSDLSSEDRQRDALHGMLGCECLQLMPSAFKFRLLLRSPHHQQDISESFLLLSLGHLGYYYKSLQQQQLRLCLFGECGKILAHCLREELLKLYRFHQAQQLQPESLIRLFLYTRNLQLRYQWLLQVCQGLTRKFPLLTALHRHLGQGNADYDELLQQWVLKVTQPLLNRITKWLLKGQLTKDFFIVAYEKTDPFLYWSSHFKIIAELLPPFLDSNLAQLLLGVGRSQHYARKYLEIVLPNSIKTEQLHQQLSEACEQSFQELNVQPMRELILKLKQQTSQLLLMQLQQLSPTLLDILSNLHQYLLLTDVDFVRKLIELLEPALEQPLDCYDVQQLNNLMEQLLDRHNQQLYVDQSKTEGKLCWSRFLLKWKLPTHWTVLLGHRLEQYSSCFVGLWQLHHADYVLSERIRRQQSHFLERIGFHHSEDALLVGESFDQFIDKLLKFMSTLRNYFLHDVLGSAFESLLIACRITKSLDELLDLHSEYLNGIECGVLQTKMGFKSHQCLADLYNIIFQLDAEQQRFLSLCPLFNKSNEGALFKEFHWSCLNTCDTLNHLHEQFQLGLVNFLLALYSTGGEQFAALAKKLDHNRYYAKRFNQLEKVNTFQFQRKFANRNEKFTG